MAVQICVAVVPRGPTNKELTSAYAKRDMADLKDELGNVLGARPGPGPAPLALRRS
jgi:hypothetical protein